MNFYWIMLRRSFLCWKFMGINNIEFKYFKFYSDKIRAGNDILNLFKRLAFEPDF